MDFDKIIHQTKIANQAVEQMKTHTRNFDRMLELAIAGAPEADKQKMEKIRVLSIKALELAKQGKSVEAQQIIKQFEIENDGR